MKLAMQLSLNVLQYFLSYRIYTILDQEGF